MSRTPINLVDMDFLAIKASLKNYLKGQDQFSDYNYEGSGLNFIIDLLAYNSQNNAYLANMLANEAEIDSAILRDNVVSRAKLMGYTPKSKTAARAVLSVTVSDPSNTATSLLLPRGTKFHAAVKGGHYTFVTMQDYNLYLDELAGVYHHDSIEVFEGKLRNFSWKNGLGSRFILPSTNIDVSTIRLVVYDSLTSIEYDTYERSFGINKIDNTSAVYWMFETDHGQYEIQFGDGVFGRAPSPDAVLYAEYLETNGPDANDIFRFGLSGGVSGYENDDITITTVAASSGGSDPESTSSIKINAPRFLSAQNRAVTCEDFISVTNDIYPYAKSVSVWGGEEEYPPQYGKVFVSIIPQSTTKLTSANKDMLAKKLARKCVVGIRPVIVDPDYIFMNVTAHVDIRRELVESAPSLADDITTRVESFFTDQLGIFDSNFYYSKLLGHINGYSRSIISSKVAFRLSKIEKAYSGSREYRFDFRNPITQSSLSSSKFSIFGSQDNVSLTDDDGVVYADGHEVGYIDYVAGVVVVKMNMQSATNNILEVFIKTDEQDVKSNKNSAIVLNNDRLSINLRAA